MAHIVSRKGYLSLEESYRDPITGKPRKKYLKYLGKRSSDPQARYEQMIATAERKGAEIDEAQRAKYGESNAERRSRLEDEARFSPQKFLQESVVQSGSTVGAELNVSKTDNHEEGEGGEADRGGGDGDVPVGHS